MIIVEVPQDPTDLVLQGAVIGDVPVGLQPCSRNPWFVLQGEIRTAAMAEIPVPRAMIGQHDWYGALPRRAGPKVMSGGELVMLDIGRSLFDVFVDPIQRWLNSVFQVDQAGFMLTLYDAKTIGAPEAFYEFMLAEPATMGDPVVNIPRGAVFRSGLSKRITAPIVPDSFGRHTMLDSFVETTRRWFVSGVTKDGSGVALGGCRVVLMRTDKILESPDILANPVVDEAVSDGGGNYSFQVSTPLQHQLFAYLAGVPDVAGITVNTVVPAEV